MEFIYPYTVEYFNTIIDILEAKGKITFNKLFDEWVKILRQTKIQSPRHRKRKHSKPTKYTPSKNQFSNILKKMLDNNYLRKIVADKSNRKLKETNYELTENARKLLQLKILKMDNMQSIFKKIYEVILLYNFVKTIYQKTIENDLFTETYEKIPIADYSTKTVFIDSDMGLNDFLTKLNIQPETLEWGLISFGASEIEQILYPYYGKGPSYRPSRLQRQGLLDSRAKYMRENKDQQITHETVNFVCHPLKDRLVVDSWALYFRINRIETWEITTSNLESKLISKRYIAYIPGVTIKEIVEHGGFTDSKVEEAISVLQEIKLIRGIWFGHEIRYVIDDLQLNEFIETIKQIFLQEFLLLLTKWEEFEIPTAYEKERMNWIFGSKEFKRISTSAEIRLHEHKYKLKKCTNLQQYMKLVSEEIMSDIVRSIDINTNISVLVQHNLKKNFTQSVNMQMFSVNEAYKEFRKMRTVEPKTEKQSIKDILEFSSYRRNRLNERLERLDFDYERYGIEIVKMEFNRILQMYPFLGGMLTMICPKAFDAQSEEKQNHIISDIQSRDQAKVELARKLDANYVDTGAVLVGNIGGKKKKKKIPYSTKTFVDPRTGNIITSTYIKI
jgi:hypothetical protein